ncbi:TonB family protein [Marinilabilia rubra]|uniref:Trypsin n=1 Tax=Marinilabilia rubra TaxID=2162893 RepID=A0A2U2B710_9BACT|nr:TonB family protein [Marinilabilia rubra]PWD98847.1 trypsin [Marinilabilia rubra]
MRTKDLFTKAAILLIILSGCFITSAKAQDKNASPYFVVLSGADEKASLPLKSTDVDVDISGVIADVTVNQTYVNAGESVIEAIYVFPASTRAAVYKMEMKVGDRIIMAKIEEKKKARKKYEEAKKEGKTASLLEEKRPNVFKMNVANIVPGATVEVKMSYTELLVPSDKVYEFVYPTVVGPRYVSKGEMAEEQTENWTENPYLKEGEKPTSTLDIGISLNTGLPIQDIRCETHKNKIEYQEKSSATVAMEEPDGGNRDFVMQYRLAGNQIETGVLLYDNPDGEKFFVAMMQPPARVEPENIPAREYVFIVDVSGSMHGFPLDVSKKLMKNLLGGLRDKDLFNIVFFAGGSYIYKENSISATKENIENAMSFVDNQNGGGGTELINALQSAMGLNQMGNYARSFVILTDGYVSVEDQTFDYIRNNLGKANFFSFGIGSGVNRHLIEGMAHVGYGEPFVAMDEKEAVKQAKKFEKYISQPVLTGIDYSFEGFNAYDVIPEFIPDLFGQRPIIISGKYRGKPSGTLKVTGTAGASEISKNLNIQADDHENKALKYLWAREKVRLLGDYASLDSYRYGSSEKREALKEEITNLGLKYNLLTKYTSFIAVDSVISNKGGEQKTVKQPNPLPDGVSNNAVDGESKMVLNVSESDVTSSGVINFSSVSAQEEVEEALVFFIVEDMAEFPGGDAALKKYLSEHLKYPKEAKEKGIEGRVYVLFIIDKEGNVTNVKIARGVSPSLDAEAIRVVKSMPKWKPGRLRGKAVPVTFTVPVNFELDDDDKSE